MVDSEEELIRHTPIILVGVLIVLQAVAFLYHINSFPITDYDLYSSHRTLENFVAYRVYANDVHGNKYMFSGVHTYEISNLVRLSIDEETNRTEYLSGKVREAEGFSLEELVNWLIVREGPPFPPMAVRVVRTTAKECGTRVCISDEVIFTKKYND